MTIICGTPTGGVHTSLGTIRALTKTERELEICCQNKYCWVVTEPYEYHDDLNGVHITVPKGFLTDGSTGGPDYGCSWLFHDYLYATHCFDGNVYCTRQEADEIMENILRRENMNLYCKAVSFLSQVNLFWLFSDAWESSGKRGPQFLEDNI
jgi:hypothetical protein